MMTRSFSDWGDVVMADFSLKLRALSGGR